MELEVLSADIQNWEGEVRFSLSAHIPTLFKDHKLSSQQDPNLEAVQRSWSEPQPLDRLDIRARDDSLLPYTIV